MGSTHFSGPIKVGPIREGAASNAGFLIAAQSGPVVFGADGTETVTAIIPANSQIIDIHIDTTVVFDAGTTNTFDLGDGTTVNLYGDALAIGPIGKVLGSSDVSQIVNYVDVGASDVSLTVTYNQSGGAATAGAATVTVLYIPGINA
jgi:hypothetical protein